MFEEYIREIVAEFEGNWVRALIISLLVFVVLIGVHAAFFRIMRRLNRRKGKNIIKNLYWRFKKPSLILLIAITLQVLIIAFIPKNELVGYLNQAISIVIVFSISWLLIKGISLGRDIILRQYNVDEKDNLKARRVYTQLKIMERIINFLIVLIAFATVLLTFERVREVGVSLFASAGVLGIILGFAAQKLIGTVLAGFQIAVTQPIRLDDVVIVENEWGWIEEITLTYIVVRIWDKRRLVLPTTYFIETPFQNWTRNSSDILGTVYIYTDYNVPFDELRKAMTKILENDPNWDGQVNVLQVTNATEKTVEIRGLVSAIDSPTAWDLRVNVREKMIEFLQQNYPGSLPRSRVVLENKED